jgi:4-amino-4-deoxy-L-arabinose transferase-like glycosyltransferase
MGEDQNQPARFPFTRFFRIDFQEPQDISSDSRRRQAILEWTFIVLLVAAAFALRIWGLSRTHFWDETVYLQNAERICCGKANYSEWDSRPPLISLIFAAIFMLWHNVYAASIVTASMNALGPALLYLSGRMIVGRIPAGIAALLLAFSPYLSGHAAGNSLMTDAPAVTLILLGFWLLLRAVREPSNLRFACAGFVLALAVLMRFASLSSVGVLSLLVLATDRWWKAALACGAGFIAGIAPYLCWSRVAYGEFFATFIGGWDNVGGHRDSLLFYLKNFGVIFSWITLAGLALWVGQWAWQNWQQKTGDQRAHQDARSEENRSGAMGAFLWLWAAVLLFFFSALSHKEPRYAMPLAPPLFLLAGIGLSALVRGRRTAVRVAGTVALAGALVYTFLPDLHRFASPFFDRKMSEEMEVSDFLNHNVPADTVLYANTTYPEFAYYTNLEIEVLPLSGSDLYDALNQLDRDGVVIAYKPINGESGEPRLEWLDANGHFRRLREFPSMVLYKFASPAK